MTTSTKNPGAIATRDRPLVSIIMANFNGAAFLAHAIVSAQKQTLRNIEIIVSDDASTDDSVEIVKQLQAADSRIRLLRSDCNAGPAAARNRAIKLATGEWIAIMDSDDLMHPERLSTLLTAAARDCADIVADDLLQVDTNSGKRSRRLLTGRWRDGPFWIDIVEYVQLNQMFGTGPELGYLKPLFRAPTLKEIATPYDESLRNSEDYHLVLRLLHSGKRMCVYPFPLYFYRRHRNSLSYRLSERALAALLVADRRFFDRIDPNNLTLRAAVAARARSIELALAYECLLSAIKSHNYGAAFAIALANPRAATLLQRPIGLRLRRLFPHRVTRESDHDVLRLEGGISSSPVITKICGPH